MSENAVAAGVLVALLLTSAVAVGAAVADSHEDDRAEANDSFGAEVSSFMQASSAETENEVEEGMFQASMRRADEEERRTLIEERKQRLAERHARLQERREEIASDESEAKNRAVATRVVVGAEGLERSVDSTREHAEQVGVDTADLEALRDMATELNGREVAGWARGLAGIGDGSETEAESSDGDRSGDWRGSPGADRGEENRGNGTDDDIGIDDGFGD